MIVSLGALIILTIFAFATSLAHVLELPGKMKLDETAYRRVQTIYYPGFTIAGVAEPLGILAAVITALLLPAGDARVLVIVAGGCLLVAHLVYWTMTHPVNGAWLEGEQLGSAGAQFFNAPGGDRQPWTALRNRWELSHVIRAAFTATALVATQFALLAAACCG